jgi:regulator of cell morphogenesis and NO signaling
MHPSATIINNNEQVINLVQNDYRTADVFKRYNIMLNVSDLTLEEACKQKNLDIDEVKSSLISAVHNINISNFINFNDWKVDFLIDYIKNIYHQYSKQRLPVIQTLLGEISVANTHINYIELEALKVVFSELYNLLITHLNTQETSVFPYIKQIYSAWYNKESYGALLVRTLRKPIEKIIANEHLKLTNLLNELRKVTNYYTLEDDKNINLNILMQQMREFDNNLLQHIDLEKNVLFPKAILIEKELTSVSAQV